MSKPAPSAGTEHPARDAATAPHAPPADARGESGSIRLSGSDLEELPPLEEHPPSAPAPSGPDGEEPEPDAAPPVDSLIGKMISDRYLVQEIIGQGGMGAVYRGEQVHLRKRVAIKVLRPTMARRVELSARFEREAIAGAHVVHPNVVAATDFGRLRDGSQFLILEYVEGTSLKDLLQNGPLPIDRALSIGRQIAQALVAVHDKGIVHRDVKPQNVLIDSRDQVKLLDFGLAKVRVDELSAASRGAVPSPALTARGIIMGTFAYMAPEVQDGMDAVDARSDLFALGVVMYELITGKRPFDEPDPALLLKRVRTEAAPTMRDRAPEVNVPPRIEAVVMRLLERDPARRFGSASELVAALDEGVKAPDADPEKPPADEPTSIPETAARTAPPQSAPRGKGRASTLLQLARALAVLAVALVVVLLVRRGWLGTDDSVAAATSSGPPTTTSTAVPETVPAEIDGLDAFQWSERFTSATSRKDWRQAATAFLALARLDAPRLLGRDLRPQVISTVVGISIDDSFTESTQVYATLETGLGTGGLDVLFDVVRSRGGTKASRRAREILSKPGTLDRATPGLRVAFELRRAPCPDKHALFGKAVEEGDDLTLEELVILRDTRCPNRRDPCCFRDDLELHQAIGKLRARLGK